MLTPALKRIARLAVALAFAVYAAACASSTGAVPHPFPMGGASPASAAAAKRTSSGQPAVDGYALVGTALALRGTPYRNGGADPQGFDCSGFTQYVFEQYGVALPRSVREQSQIGKPVKSAVLAPGDLIFFATTDRDASHVAIAVGGDEFVHAPSSTGVVRVERLSAGYWSHRYLGARRVGD
jgi:cell wall-associated NlpC family hydrolase